MDDNELPLWLWALLYAAAGVVIYFAEAAK